MPRTPRKTMPAEDLDELARAVAARAYLYDDPAAFRAGVQELREAVRRIRYDLELLMAAEGGAGRYTVVEDRSVLRAIESY